MNGEEIGCTFCCPGCGGEWEGWVDCGRSDDGIGEFSHFAEI